MHNDQVVRIKLGVIRLIIIHSFTGKLPRFDQSIYGGPMVIPLIFSLYDDWLRKIDMYKGLHSHFRSTVVEHRLYLCGWLDGWRNNIKFNTKSRVSLCNRILKTCTQYNQ